MVDQQLTKARSAEQRIVDLGIYMPPAPKPLGAYSEVVQGNNLLFITGTLPVLNGKLEYVGTLGRELDVLEGQKASRMAALNALAAAREHLGTLDRIVRVLKTEVYLVTTDAFVDFQPKIADGASELLLEIFGENGRSVRKIMGVTSVPLRAPLMVELLLEIESNPGGSSSLNRE